MFKCQNSCLICQHIVQENVDGQKFASNAELQSAVRQTLGQQSTFFASGIQKLVDGWEKCLHEFGRYVES